MANPFDSLLNGLGNLGGGGLFGQRQGFGQSLNDLAQMQQMQQSATAHQMEMQRRALEMEMLKQYPPAKHPYENIEREHIADALVYGTGTEKISIRYNSFREQLQAEVDAWLAPVTAI